VAEEEGFFPLDFAATAEGDGVALVVTEFYQRAAWFVAEDAGGVWQRELVDFGGATGFWPALVTSGGATTPCSGRRRRCAAVIHARD